MAKEVLDRIGVVYFEDNIGLGTKSKYNKFLNVFTQMTGARRVSVAGYFLCLSVLL